MKIVTFFNHKGGVAKTTNAFNLGWKMAADGNRVLLVDADSQCNLTGLSMGLLPLEESESLKQDSADFPAENTPEGDDPNEAFDESQHAAESFWSKIADANIYTALKPVFMGEPKPLEPVECIQLEGNSNLYLLPGSIELASYESELGVAQSLLGAFGSQVNLPGAIYALLSRTAERHNIDVIIVDVSPSLGAINQNIVCISDYVIIPCSPDYFSVMALRSLAKILPEWFSWAHEASRRPQLSGATYPLPAPRFKLAGIVVSRYVVYKKKPARAFESWIQKVFDECMKVLVPSLAKVGALASPDDYSQANIHGYDLARIREFNSLRPKSQMYRVPPYALTDEQIGLSGNSLKNSQDQRDELDSVYASFAQRIENLTRR